MLGTSGCPDGMVWEGLCRMKTFIGLLINQQGFDKIRRFNKMVTDDLDTEVLLSPMYTERASVITVLPWFIKQSGEVMKPNILGMKYLALM